MKKEYLRVISEYMGVFPVRINSNLVSAQNRDRWYWTNIRTKETGLFSELWVDIPQPDDKGILLKDILQPESEVDEKYYIKNPKIGFDGMDIDSKSNCLRTSGKASQSKKHNCDIIKVDKQGNKKADQSKAGCLTAGGNSGGNHSDMDIICVSMVGRKINKEGVHEQKSPTLTINSWEQNNILQQNYKLRRLTPRECGRLQTFTDKELDVLLGGYVDIDYKINYICNSNVCLNHLSCQHVKLKDAKIKSQLKRLNSALNITSNNKEKVIWNIHDQKLIKQKSAKPKDAREINNQLMVIASCTINDLLDMELQNFQKEIVSKMKNVHIAIKRLERQELKECATSTTDHGLFMIMPFTSKIKGQNQDQQGIFEIQMEFQFTGKSWKVIWGEILKEGKLSIISTWIKQIIDSVIYTYAKNASEHAIIHAKLRERFKNGIEISDLQFKNGSYIHK
jgi:hypothetical protein